MGIEVERGHQSGDGCPLEFNEGSFESHGVMGRSDQLRVPRLRETKICSPRVRIKRTFIYIFIPFL